MIQPTDILGRINIKINKKPPSVLRMVLNEILFKIIAAGFFYTL